MKLQLSAVLEGVFSQRLVPGIDGRRVVAYEVLLTTPAVRTTVREGKTHQIDTIIQTSGEAGMSTLEPTLAKLVKEGKITVETAQSYAIRPEELERLLRT